MSIACVRYDLAGQFMATESTDLTPFMVFWDLEININQPRVTQQFRSRNDMSPRCILLCMWIHVYILIVSFLLDLSRDGCTCFQRYISDWTFDIVSFEISSKYDVYLVCERPSQCHLSPPLCSLYENRRLTNCRKKAHGDTDSLVLRLWFETCKLLMPFGMVYFKGFLGAILVSGMICPQCLCMFGNLQTGFDYIYVYQLQLN